MANVPKEGLPDLEKRCQLIIDELKSMDNYCILDDKNFCFVAVEKEVGASTISQVDFYVAVNRHLCKQKTNSSIKQQRGEIHLAVAL